MRKWTEMMHRKMVLPEKFVPALLWFVQSQGWTLYLLLINWRRTLEKKKRNLIMVIFADDCDLPLSCVKIVETWDIGETIRSKYTICVKGEDVM